MKKGKKLYEGKAKILYSAPEKGTAIQHFKDHATAFNNLKKSTIEGKGILNNRISEHILSSLNQIGIETHLIKRINMREQLIKLVEIIPIEFVIRNIATGSLTKRLGIEDGTVLEKPLLEFCYKNDDLHDPLIIEDLIVEMNWATRTELSIMKEQGHIIHKHMTDYWAQYDLRLIDAKYEFGKDKSGNIMLADEITCDSQRIWTKDGKSLDKDVFRQGDNMQDVEDVYNYIHTLISADEIKEK